MKATKTFLLAALAAYALGTARTAAAPDDSYQQNDLLLFFLNPTGTVGTDQIAFYSLGSTWSVFRNAATPTDPNFGTVIDLGNINSILTSTYGGDWANLSSSLYVGAAGNNGSTASISTAVSNGDYARTVYVTKPRLGPGTLGQANSSTATLNTGNSAGTSSAISGANSPLTRNTNVTANPFALPDSGSEGLQSIKEQNPFGPTGAPATAYGAIQGGVVGPINSSTYTYGSVSNVALGLDLYRITPSTNNAAAWQNVNNISGVTAGQGYFLGTITLSSDGKVNFVVRSDEPPVTDDYTVWTEGYPGADLTDKEADYDKDGFKNVAEYAFGTDPTVGTPALLSSAITSNNLVVSFQQRTGPTNLVPVYTVLTSSNLPSPFTTNSAVPYSATTSSGYQQISVTNPAVGGRGFYRIRATLP